MDNFLLEEQQMRDNLAILAGFIRSDPDSRELKKALAIKMALEGKPYGEITKLLEVNKSFISFWKQKFIEEGLKGIRLGHKGSKGYLTSEERLEVIEWLQTKNYWSLDELITHIDLKYGVLYKSRGSYYKFFNDAGISWKKSQKINPKSDPELVKKKQEEIQDFIRLNQAEIQSEQLVLLFVDECHLCWGDVCGFVWGKTDIRIEIPIKNERERQTYFGALNYQTKQFILLEYDTGDGKNTVDFMKKLQTEYPQKRIVLIWDGASYHKSQEIKDFLEKENKDRNSAEWKFTCILFAPNSPEQNPVEDVWLQGKNFLRSMWNRLGNFTAVKFLFSFFLDHHQFDFSKIQKYAPCSEII